MGCSAVDNDADESAAAASMQRPHPSASAGAMATDEELVARIPLDARDVDDVPLSASALAAVSGCGPFAIALERQAETTSLQAFGRWSRR